MSKEIIIETDAKSRLITYAYFRDTQKLFEDKSDIPYYNICSHHIIQYCLLFYNSIPSTLINTIRKTSFFIENDTESDPLTVVSIRRLDCARRNIYQPFIAIINPNINKIHDILAIECIETNTENKAKEDVQIYEKIVYVFNNSSELSILQYEDQISMDDIDISMFVEYRYTEQNEWNLSRISLDSFLYYRKSRFNAWKRSIENSDSMSSFYRLLRIGLFTKLHCRICFPMCAKEQDNWIKKDKHGKYIHIPRPIHSCRIWSPKQRWYIHVDCHLDDAPKEEDAEQYWNDMVDKFRDNYNETCFNRALSQDWNAYRPNDGWCLCGCCERYD
eukprot:171674_1